MTISQAFGLKLRKYRKKQQLTQEKLAEEAGLHRTYVSLVERGQRTPTLDACARLAEALNVSLTSLLKEAEEKVKNFKEK